MKGLGLWTFMSVVVLVSSLLAGEAVREGVTVGADCAIGWTASTTKTVTAHRLYVGRQRGSYFAKPISVPMPTTTATCTALKLTEDGQYYLVARAVAGGQESADSNIAPFYRDTQPAAEVSAPTALTLGAIDVGASAAIFGWTPPTLPDGSPAPGIQGYILAYGRNSGTYEQAVRTGAIPSGRLEHLTRNQLYYVAVRAIDDQERMGPYSTELAVRPFPTPAQTDTTPPTVAMQEIHQGATIIKDGGTVVRKAAVVVVIEAEDAGGVYEVELMMGAGPKPAERVCVERSRPFECVWHVPAKPGVSYTLQAIARDMAGNTARSAPLTVTSK